METLPNVFEKNTYISPSDTIASIALIISFLTMIAAFRDIALFNKANSNLQRITLRLDFSHRYQEIMLAMPDSNDPDRIKKYVLLYFDLCSEEYRLWKSGDGIVDNKTWHLWENGNFQVFFTSHVQESDNFG